MKSHVHVLGAAFLALLVAASSAHSDEVFLKDGTILKGQVVSQKEVVNDPASGQAFAALKAGGFFAVADGVRIVIFSSKQVDPTQGEAGSRKGDFLGQFTTFQRRYNPGSRQPQGGSFRGAGPFNERGVRILKMTDPAGKDFELPQIVTVVNPHGVQITAKEYAWRSHYLTSEFDRKIIRELINTFPEAADTQGKPDVDKRMKIYRFLLQAKWFDEAARELDTLVKLVPEAKERVENARSELREVEALDTLDQANQALLAGQFRYAQAMLAKIPIQNLPGTVKVKANTVQVRVDNIAKQWDMAVRYLRQLPDEVDGPDAELLCEAAESIRENLYLESLDRLEPFISLAEQAERQRKQRTQPTKKPEQLLSLALTGWLLGKESAQDRPEAARKLWKARRFVMRYVTANSARIRDGLLKNYTKDEPVELDELARIISLLPPAQPDDASGLEPIKRRAVGPRETDYHVQLPLDYYPGRPYPVVIVLNNENQRPQDILQWYRREAAMNGFLLVAADWSGGTFGPYVYDVAAHERVLEVIHDLKLRFPIDTDRVFLSGWGHGANAAWDIGLSHPDLFAGVAPISSQPKLSHTLPLYRNAQNLPMYIVTGDLAGEAPKEIQRVVGEMINRGFPILHSIYRGRGLEWFSGELPYIFDWMNRKRRYSGMSEVGRFPGGFGSSNEEYQSMRSTDNHFWWLSSNDFMDHHLIENKQPKRDFNPARFQGSIKPGNQISVYSLGLRNMTLHFGPGMIDYTKPIRIAWTGYKPNYVWTNNGKPLQPSLQTLMDDLRDRRDRNRLVYVKVELPAAGK